LGWDVRLGLASGLDKGPIPFVGIAQPMVLKKGDPRKKNPSAQVGGMVRICV